MHTRRLLISLFAFLVLAAPAHAATGWTATGNLDGARSWQTATLLANGKVLVAGGDNQSVPVATSELYDPATGRWSPAGRLITARTAAAATLLADGKVLIAGGYGPGAGQATATAELYDPATNAWTAVPSTRVAHARGTLTRLPDGRVLLAGGEPNVRDSEVFNPTTHVWEDTGTLTHGRYDAAAAPLPNGDVLVAGGYSSDTGFEATAERYNPATGTWSPAGAINPARSLLTAMALADGKVLAVGGTTGGGPGSRATAELYDPQTNTWSGAAPMSTPRYFFAATRLANGRVLVLGGATIGDGATATTEIFDPATGGWSPAGSLRSGRWALSATLLPNGRVLASGGYGGVYSSAGDLWTPTTSLAADPAVAFGDHATSATTPGSVQVTNTGDSPLLLDSFALAGVQPADFAVNGDRCRTVAVGATCVIDVSFTPAAAGARSAVLTFAANTATGTHAVALNGIGVADGDGDGVNDANDRCRTLKGSAARQGCPKGLLADPSIRYKPSGKGIRVVAYYVKATSGARVTVKCSKGCKRTITKGKGAKRVRITRLNNHRLANGTKITITVAKTGRLTTTVVDRVSRGRRIEGRPRCTPVGC